MIKENQILVNEEKNKDSELDKYLVQKPNRTTLGIPLPLHLYNFGNTDFEMTFEEWAANHEKKYKRYERIFSKKQTYVIYSNKRGVNNWFLTKGEAPVIYDASKAVRSSNTLRDYYISQGFFEAEVTHDLDSVGERQVRVNYRITPNEQYYIDSVSTDIESATLDSIYKSHEEESFLKQGNPFIFEDFEREEARLVSLFRNNGVFQFKNNSMGFWTDSIQGDYKKSVELKIPDRVVRENGQLVKKPYKIQTVNRINVYSDFSIANRGRPIQDSAVYGGYRFYTYDKMKFRPKYLTNSLFITPNGIYKDAEKTQTQNYIRNLRTFSSNIDISYTVTEGDSLTADIYLTPLKKYALTVDLDATTSNIKPFGILGKFSFLGRNMFKGSEILELSFQGSIFNVSNPPTQVESFFNAWEILSSASLRFPRILFPLNTSKLIPKYMAPATTFDASVGFQKNIGLDRQNTTAGMAYTWKSSRRVGHRLDLFNFQYINNQNVNNYFQIYQSEYDKLADVSETTGEPLPENTVENYNEILDFNERFLGDPANEQNFPEEYNTVSDVDERHDILIENSFVPVISYSFVYNTRENIDDNDFSYFTARFISAGTFSDFVFRNTNEDGQRVLFDVPVAQYFKTEIEYKKYWELQSENILVFRTFAGAAFPYGNSDNVPFSRSYSAGGSNELRAWRTFDLGPGAELNNLEYNVATFKLVANLEYRFRLSNKFYSALFVDAGNIWDITDSNLVTEEGKLKSFSDLKNAAIGSGLGIRYDFSFLVFRFDVGFKTYEPYLPSSNKWFVNYNFGNAVYNIGINYPF